MRFLIAALLLAPALAFAQDRRVIVKDEPDAMIQVGGGVHDFTEGLDAETNPGTGWDVRAVFAPKSPIGMEAAYFGAINELKGSDSSNDAGLLTNGGEALIRTNFGGDHGDVQPYLAAGLGIASHSIVNRDDMTDEVNVDQFDDSTDLLVPAAAGVDLYLGRNMTLGARLGYKFYFEDKVVADKDASDIQAWTATARLGAAF